VTVSAVRNIDDLKRLAAGGSAVVLISSLYAVYQRIQGVEVNKSYVDVDNKRRDAGTGGVLL